MIVLKTQQLGG